MWKSKLVGIIKLSFKWDDSMKKIVFVMTSLGSGGIATSLKNLLEELNENSEYSMDLVLFHERAHDRETIPNNVHIISAGTAAELIALSQSETMRKNFFLGLIRLASGGICKILGHGIAYKFLFKFCKKLRGYDVAISCSQSSPLHRLYGGCNEYVLNNIDAKKKAAFIHCDYVSYGINDKYSHGVYGRFDSIAVVSDSVGKVFLEEEPDLRGRTFTVRNCNNTKRILQLANENPVNYDKKVLNIITVARPGREKGHIRVIPGLTKLKESGASFKWYLVGVSKSNAPEDFLRELEQNDLLESVILCGDQENPYRFMKNADVLLVPSIHEAAPMVFDEACILHLPVITTNTVSASEMVKTPGIGYVCENSEKGIADALLKIAQTPNLLDNYRKNTYKCEINNTIQLAQFKKLIGEES